MMVWMLHHIFNSYFTEMVGEEFASLKSGVLTSPKFPHFYPQQVNSTETIQVTKGNVIKMQFRYIHTEGSQDYLWIVEDGVGHLTYKMYGSLEARDIFSRTETVCVMFPANTDPYWRSWRSGWRMIWTEVAPVCDYSLLQMSHRPQSTHQQIYLARRILCNL